MAHIALERVSKRLGEIWAVKDVSLTVEQGEFFSLLGPSGCGKTTTLRLLAGFERLDSGRICFDGEDVSSLTPQRRNTALVFQNYALFPHMSVYENVAFGLKARKLPRPEIPGRVSEALDLVRMGEYASRNVSNLSGGQQQRIALARALATRPRILLLDEPLSNLDAALREETRGEIRTLQRELGITTIYVTHDQSEALALSDRIAVMKAGRLVQMGTPDEVYARPTEAFVAGFLGDHNLFRAELAEGEAGRPVLNLPDEQCLAVLVNGDALPAKGPVECGIRSDRIQLAPAGSSADALVGRVINREFMGVSLQYQIAVGELRWKASQIITPDLLRFEVGDNVEVHVDDGALLIFSRSK